MAGGRPRRVEHPELGELTYRFPAWDGIVEAAGQPLQLRLHAGRKGPDASLLCAAAVAVSAIARLETIAREHAQPDHDGDSLELVALEVQHPAGEWLERLGRPRDPAAITVALQFAIAGDRNVQDVIFLDGAPVELDYHSRTDRTRKLDAWPRSPRRCATPR